MVVVLPLHKAKFLNVPYEFYMRIRSGMFVVYVPIFVFTPPSLAVSQTHTPPRFCDLFETPGLARC